MTETASSPSRAICVWNRIWQSTAETLAHPAASWAVILYGAIARIAQYLSDRSLWVDESFLAHNVLDRSFAELNGPLFHNQAAPLGYLALTKLCVLVFGESEYVLRLVPLLAGLASLYLFYLVGRRLLAPHVVPIALLLFAASDRLIYFASELKQYSSDVAVALGMLLVAYACLDDLAPRRMALLATLGAAGVWLSHPAIFVLAGAGICLALFAAIDRDWPRAGRLAAIGTVWAASFGVAYLVSLGKLTQNPKHQRFWNASFLPMPPFSAEAIAWLKTTFLQILESPLGLTPVWMAVLLLIVGTVFALVARTRRGLVLVSPLLLCLLASGLRAYPFGNRLVLFLVPVFLLLVGLGIEAVWTRVPMSGPPLALALAAVVLFTPVVDSVKAIATPRTREEIKPNLSYLARNRQPGDAIFVYYAAQYPFRYYAARYGISLDEVRINRISRRKPEQYLRDLDTLRGAPRAWILFSHATSKHGLDEEAYYLDHLDGLGTRIDERHTEGSSLYLYDLSEAPPAQAVPGDDEQPADAADDVDDDVSE